MQNYTTQMDAARKGIVTPEMEIVAKKEYRTTEEIRQLVAEGKVAIPAVKVIAVFVIARIIALDIVYFLLKLVFLCGVVDLFFAPFTHTSSFY